jgi:hypothetical protein
LGWGERFVRLAAIDLLVGPAKRAEVLEGLNQPESQTSLLATCPPAHRAIHAELSEKPKLVT